MPTSADSLEQQIEAAARLLDEADYVIALTGAGMSVESGIPPFRGPGGLWTKHGEPAMNGYERFLQNPRKAWEERLSPKGPMRELWETLQSARPNAGHDAMVRMERLGVLRCVITQNVDALHDAAGTKRLAAIHGNYLLVRCIECGARYRREEIPTDSLPPLCPTCSGILKSDTVSFGEPIPSDVLARCFDESARADSMLVSGTSATVYPAAQLPLDVKRRGGVLIEVNLYESELTPLCDISLRGPSAVVLPRLVAGLERLR